MTREELKTLATSDRDDMIQHLASWGIPAAFIAPVVGRSVNRVYMDIARLGVRKRARLRLKALVA